MFRISACLIALLIACTPLSIAESSSLISQNLITADKVNYKTVTVEQGDYAPTLSAAAEEFFPNTYSLSMNESGAYFEAYNVSRNDTVKKGDVLATFTMESDDVALATLQLELENTKKALDERLEDEENAALDRQRALLAAADPYERRMILLQSERAELVCEQYKFNQQYAISQIQEQIDEILARQAGNVIVSPVDGVVDSIELKRVGEAIREGEILIEISSTEDMLLSVNNGDGIFRYGAEVDVEVGPNNERVVLKGKVVGADTLIPLAERTQKSYIRLENPDDLKLNRPIATSPALSLKDVTLVNRSVLSQQGGEYFVTVISDGVPLKKYINCVVHSSVPKAWVLQGLEPGDEIIID